MKQKIILFALCCITLYCSCNNSNSSTNTNVQQTALPAASLQGAGAPNNPDPLVKIAEIIKNCTKVEYMMYNLEYGFESDSPQKVMSFFSHIENIKPNESQCKPETYDCGVVFKDAKGDIKQTMEINIYPQCNRVVMVADNKTYFCRLNAEGLAFFQKITSSATVK